MKIFRWLLSHSFLILLIVAVIYGYMFWGNLAGKDTPAGKALAYLSNEFVAVEKFVNAVKDKQAQLSEQQSSETSETADADTSVDADKPTLVSEAMPTNRSIEQQPAATGYGDMKQNSAAVIAAETGIKQNSAPSLANRQETGAVSDAQSVNDVVVMAEVKRDTKEVFVSAEVEKQLNNVDEHGEVINESQPGDAIKANWITARKSFYQRNYELSEQSYQKVIDSTKDNFDAYGELGNVYFNQGKKEQAASAYFEAAAILVRKGQINRARSLMGLLHHLDKSKADELQRLIDSTIS